MALEHPRLLAASLTAALAACSTSSETAAPPAQPDNGNTPTPEGTPTAQQPGTPQGQGPATLNQQRTQALVDMYLQTAERLRADNKLDAALTELQKARELAPENERVRNMLSAVQAERGVPIGTPLDFHNQMAQQQKLAEERGRALVEEKLQDARTRMAAHDYKGAVEVLHYAKTNIDVGTNIDWQDLPTRVQALLADAEQQVSEQARMQQAQFNDQLSQKLAEERQTREASRQAKRDMLLREAQRDFAQRRFKHAQELARAALDTDPSSAIAQEMLHASTKAARDQATDDYYHQKAAEIRALLERQEELKAPQTAVLKMDDATWERAQARVGTAHRHVEMDPQDAAVWEQVRSVPVGRLTYTEESGDYNEVIKQLWNVTSVPIIVTPAGREAITSESLKMQIELVESLSLKNFLDLMVQRSANLAWTVRNGVVVVSTKADASGAIISSVYDVRDIIFKHAEFVPPRILDLPSGESGGDTPRAGGEGEETYTFIELSDLVDNIKNVTDPTYWDSEGVSINPEDAGYLVVKASPEFQERVAGVIADMRRFATPVVTIDSKFLTVTRNFLQEVGVDFRGLGGAGNKGDTASLDDVTNGLQNNSSRGLDNGGTGDPAANPLAGAFYNDGGDGDVRGRSENFFTSALGSALTPNGGLTASWTYLGDTQFQMILRAIEKQEEAEVVNSQILSVVDRGRGYVAVINQTAYVRDFDVEVAQASFIADPKVDVVQDGIVLDVQPVIQQDRKYIILNLNPTIAELQRPIPTFTTSLAGSTLPVTLQLPNLTVTSFATTARVPDGGSVLLGGLRQILTKERRAEVPLLARLPLVSFFFKQEGSVDENRNLMVMVRAWITDVRDLEVSKVGK